MSSAIHRASMGWIAKRFPAAAVPIAFPERSLLDEQRDIAAKIRMFANYSVPERPRRHALRDRALLIELAESDAAMREYLLEVALLGCNPIAANSQVRAPSPL